MRTPAQSVVGRFHTPPGADTAQAVPPDDLTQPVRPPGLAGTNAVLDELDALLRRADSPGQQPETLEALERLTAMIRGDGATRATCDNLRRLARTFYAEAAPRHSLAEASAAHFRMLWCVESIRNGVA